MGIGRRLTWLATASLALSAAGIAHAQQAPTPAPAPAEEAAPEEIDEADDIVVPHQLIDEEDPHA